MSKLIILIPAFWACIFDLIITAVSQPSAYWNGNLEMSNEGNPLVEFFMQYSIFGIFIFVILWITLIIIIGFLIPSKSLRILSLFVLVAHTWGAGNWLAIYFGFWYALILIFVNAALFIITEDIYWKKTGVKQK